MIEEIALMAMQGHHIAPANLWILIDRIVLQNQLLTRITELQHPETHSTSEQPAHLDLENLCQLAVILRERSHPVCNVLKVTKLQGKKKTPSGAKGERFKSPLTARKTDVDSACPQSATKRTPAHKKAISRQSPTATTEESSAADNNNIVEGFPDQHTEDQPQEGLAAPELEHTNKDTNDLTDGLQALTVNDVVIEGDCVADKHTNENSNESADGLQALSVNDVVIEGECEAEKPANENTDELMDGMQAMTVNDSVGEGAGMAETNETETF